MLVLRAGDRSVTEIANDLTAQGTPVSAQTVWAILKSEGLERLERRRPGGPAPRLEPSKAKAIGDWPTGARYDCDHAGLYLLLPAMTELGLDTLVDAARYPATTVLSAFHSLGSLLMLKCSRRGRAANAFPLGADPGLGLALGLVALPKATHLTSYSDRARRSSNVTLLEHLARRARQVGLYSGDAGFNLDFHTIRHHGEQVPLEEHYVVSRSQRTRSVLTFFAQDHASTEMVYANADLTKAERGESLRRAASPLHARIVGIDPREEGRAWRSVARHCRDNTRARRPTLRLPVPSTLPVQSRRVPCPRTGTAPRQRSIRGLRKGGGSRGGGGERLNRSRAQRRISAG